MSLQYQFLGGYRRHLNALPDLYAISTHLGGHALKPLVMGTSQACTKLGGCGKGQVSDPHELGVLPGTMNLGLGLRSEQE